MTKLLCTIPSTPRTYEIEIHPGILTHQNLLLQNLKPLGSRFAFVTDDAILELYGQALHQILQMLDWKPFCFHFRPVAT